MAARLIAILFIWAALSGCVRQDNRAIDEFDPMYLSEGPSRLAVRVNIERIEYPQTESSGIEGVWAIAEAPAGAALGPWADNGLRIGVVEGEEAAALKERLKEIHGANAGSSEVSITDFDITLARRPGTSVFLHVAGDERKVLDANDLKVLVSISLRGRREDARLVVAPAWSTGRGPVQVMEELSITMPATEQRVYVIGPSGAPPEMSMGWTLGRHARPDGAGALALVRVKFR